MTHSATSPTGILIIDKPRGITSMQVCRVIRRRLINGGAPKRVKVGHGGTLDPLATGVLVVLIGKATKHCDRIMAGRKRYAADVDLSCTTDTDDYEGERTHVRVDDPPMHEAIESALTAFVGTIQQRPPAYSAMKVGGRRAYRLARKGESPILEPRPVTIHGIDIIGYEWPILRLDIACGKGTYIRSIARDLGAALHTGGCLAALRRTEVAPFTIEQAVALDDVPDPLSQGDLLPINAGC